MRSHLDDDLVAAIDRMAAPGLCGDLSNHPHPLMHLYTGTSTEFISDATQNLIACKISESFFESFRYRAPKSEVASWRNSLRAMADAPDFGFDVVERDAKHEGLGVVVHVNVSSLHRAVTNAP